ncbi:MAG: MFS transporter, partial [Clostridia bacterium]|nr:MFS transporter [Clostridia bacterium]
VGSLIAVVLLGAIKFSPKARYLILAITFPLSEIFMLTAYLQTEFALTCVFGLLGMLTNTAGNTVFSAAMMVAIPKDRRGAILGFVSSASVGGSALSALAYGFLGEIFPLETVFSVGCLLGLIPMLYMCLNRRTKKFIVENTKGEDEEAQEEAPEEAPEEVPEETVNESIE